MQSEAPVTQGYKKNLSHTQETYLNPLNHISVGPLRVNTCSAKLVKALHILLEFMSAKA